MSNHDAIRQLNHIPVHIQTNDFVADLLWWGMYENEWWRNYLHVHSFYEICYAFAGEGTFFINNIQHPVKAGDIFIARPNDYHEIISSKTKPLGIYFWSYTLSILTHDNDTANLLTAFMDSEQYISQKSDTLPLVLNLLTDEVRRCEAGYVQSIQALTIKLLVETARAVTDITVDTGINIDSQSPLIREVIQYLKDNYHQPVLIRDIAAQVHMSERHVSRLFLKSTQKTIKTYLRDLRLNTACKLLLKSDSTITEIAEQVGYPDVRYFSTLFRKQFGKAPTRFRENNGTSFVD